MILDDIAQAEWQLQRDENRFEDAIDSQYPIEEFVEEEEQTPEENDAMWKKWQEEWDSGKSEF